MRSVTGSACSRSTTRRTSGGSSASPTSPNGSDELADASAEASRECDVIILANHGCSTLGDTVEMAWRRALNLEEAALNTFRCLQLGDTETTFPADQLGTVRHR